MSIAYRMTTDNDVDRLVDFWRQNSGWDQIDRKEWERRFYYTPYGNSPVAIAIDESSKQILSQMIFIPSEVSVEGSLVKSRRPYAVVFKKDFRQDLGLIKMMTCTIKMYKTAVEDFKRENVGLVYTIPDPGWVRVFKFVPNAQTGSYPLWSLSLPVQQTFDLPPGYCVKTVAATDPQIDQLWMMNSKLYGCCIRRDTHTLPWKTSHGEFKLLGLFQQEKLVGLSVSQLKGKDKQWLICDLLAADEQESLEFTLKATCNAAHDFVVGQATSLQKVAVLVPPGWEPIITKIGFQKDNYQFPMVVHLLDQSISKKTIAPERWYASAND